MAKVSENDILNMSQDWGYDASNGLPYSGRAVQKFIKERINSKAGVFYNDTTNNRYLVFADEEARDKYLADTSQKELLIGTFDAPFNYTAEINVLSPTYNAVEFGSKGNYLEYTFDIKNKSGTSTGESVDVTYTFKRNATQKIVKETRRYGETIRFNIDDYLLTGTNVVTINIIGQTSLAATTVAVTYQAVSLSLIDELDITKIYNLLTGDNTLSIPYTLSGQGIKTMEWYIDGEQVTPNISEDEVTDTTVSKTKYITLSALSTGVHNVQIRAYTLVGGEKFYTDTLYREIMVVNEPFYTETLFAVKAIVPKEYGIIGPDSTFMLYGAEQYLPYNVKFATNKSGDVAIKFGESSSELTTLSTIEVVQGVLSDFSVTPKTAGLHVIRLATADFSREINILISETSLDLKEITDALEFSFTARGRSNSAVDKDVWEGHNHTAAFEGFKWNNQSGWVDNALLIGEGARVSFDYAPLASNSVNTGKTIELEFATRNVDNENTVICDLRNADGTGLLLTASEARLVSKVGSVVYTKFKSDDRNRITFVINRNTNVVNKNLVFIYINGILSGAINYGSADNYLSDTLLSLNGTAEAQIALYDVLVYNTALSSSQILNNYILYRANIEDMRGIYDKNDILEEGNISVDKTRRNIPVMIVTGDLLDLDEKSDTDYYITADIDYYNDPDPTKNFRIEGARIRIQGTSSRFYPRKNYRFYTNKADYTVLYDANGNVVADGLYAFKDGAQPVDCWCLKADFAESSGSHNTGVARIWNEVMTNASFSHTNNTGVEVSGYPLRTQAQTIAKSIGFGKDVRTTIDGFPILLFRRDTKNDEPIFVGKYNFNNDKSTPSVFGFTGIPDFNDSKVQSWECLENEDPIALFKTVDGFFDDAVDAEGKPTKRWELAFEARHEGADASIYDLYGFCYWVVSKNGKTEEFATEKWEHMDVYKVAAYYVYLMRFGALDQVVKNCFLTSEDGVHFYFINYDNDTILGVDNTGEISAMPDVTRQTQYANGSYVYAGHESVLWNMLEADSEFMAIVRIVDSALYSAGLTYKAVLDMFNNKQSGQWVERVYNEDAQYKYIAPYTDKGINYLSSLQGSRKSHRTWWLSKRFSLYDSLFASGDFTAKAVEMKCLSGTPAGHAISIVSGIDMNYGYGLNRVPREIGVHVPIGESHTFIVDSELGIGTPVAIYAAPYLRSLDLSDFAPYINTLNVSNVNDDTLGSRLRRLVVGKDGVENHDLNAISGINMATRLQELDIRGLKGITSLDLSNQTELVSLEATGSGLASITFAKGAPITTLNLPASVLALNLEQLPKLSTSGLSLENLQGIESMTIKGCPLLSKDISFVTSWIDAAGEDVSLYMDNIEWNDVNYEDLIRIGSLSNVTLRGYAKITESSQEIVDALSSLFGNDVFNSESDFCIDAPASIFLNGPSEILEGEDARYNVVIFPTTLTGSVKWSLEGSRTGLTMTDGYVTTVENGYSDSYLKIGVLFIPNEGDNITVKKDFIVRRRTYPSSSNMKISGPIRISDNGTYTLSVNGTYTGEYYTDWSLGGDIANSFNIKRQSDKECEIVGEAPALMLFGTISATIKKRYNDSTIATLTYDISAVNDNIAETDPVVCQIMHNAGLCANTNYLTKEEARFITNEDIATIFKGKDIVNFDGFQYFTSITEIPNSAFDLCSKLKTITLPPNVEIIKQYAFRNLHAIEKITFPDKIKTIESYAFHNQNLYSHNVIINITNISSWCNIDFTDTTSNPVCMSGIANRVRLYVNDVKTEDLVIPEGVTKIKQYAFRNEFGFNSITIPDSVEIIERQGFFSQNNSIKTNIFGGKNVKTLGFLGFNPDNINNIEKGSNIVAVNNIPHYVGYWAYHNGSGELMNFRTGCFVKGENRFEIPSSYKGVYFEGMATKKTIYLDWTGKVEDISGLLVNAYVTINIQSNKSEATFKITYTNTSNVTEEQSIGIGTHLLPIKFRTYVDIINEIEYQGYIFEPINRFIGDGTTSIICNYKEQVHIYIKHTNGSLYTTDDWSAGLSDGTLSNDNADGVCIMQEVNGGFVIAKTEDSSSALKWGGYNKTIMDVVTSGTTSVAQQDFDGYGNTQKIIEQLAGYTDSQGTVGAPAAEACVAYTFPSGAKGYLPALGEWKVVSNNKDAVNSALSLIGGTAINGEYSGYWSSTQSGESMAHYYSFGSGSSYTTKNTSWKVRAFSPHGNLIIKSTLKTSFDVSYTNNQGKSVTRTVGVGSTLFNVKMGTTMTITPHPIGNLTAEAQTITWDDTVKEVSFAFAKDAGVYIQHANGSLHTEAEWTAAGYTNDVANGVAILSATEPAFVIAKVDASSFLGLKWGGYGKEITGIVAVANARLAALDLEGYGNTQKIIEQLAGYTDSQGTVGAPAAEACVAYTFPSGAKGYLPALGQWQAAYINKDAVNSALSLIGGTAINGEYSGYWSSTQSSNKNVAWRLNWGSGSMDTQSNRANSIRVRAFASL